MAEASPPAVGRELDSFPVGIVARAIRRPETLAYLVVYAVAFVILTARLICPSRPKHRHRKGAYICFVGMAMMRVPLFALGLVFLNHSGGSAAAATWDRWGIVCAMDVLSVLGYQLFCAGVYSLTYSWSNRIPCVYCMVQFSDSPHALKAFAVYLIPILAAVLSIAGTITRLVAVSPEGFPQRHRYWQGTMVARAGAILSFACTCCLCVVLPYTAIQRYRSAAATRDVDHRAVADMIQNQRIEEATTITTASVCATLCVLGCTLIPEGMWRILVVQTSRITYDESVPWTRTPAAWGVLTVMFELVALILLCTVDFDDLDRGNLGVWNPGACKEKLVRMRGGRPCDPEGARSSVYLGMLHSCPNRYSGAAQTASPAQSPREKMFDSTAELVNMSNPMRPMSL